MLKNSKITTMFDYLKQTTAYFIVFSFILSMMTVANICLIPAETEAHAATCPYTGPAIVKGSSTTPLVYSILPSTKGETVRLVVSKSNAKNYGVGDSYTYNKSQAAPGYDFILPATTLQCAYCDASINVYEESSLSSYYCFTGTLTQYYLSPGNMGPGTYVYTFTITDIKPLSECLSVDTSGNMPAHEYTAASHTCNDSCRELLHTHSTALDYTSNTYTCTNTTTNYHKDKKSYTAGDDEWGCGHAALYQKTTYYCKQCGTRIYELTEDGCTKSSCENYYGNEGYYYYDYYNGTSATSKVHTHKQTGTQKKCTSTTVIEEYTWYESSSCYDYDVYCASCGFEFFTYYKDTESGVSSSFGMPSSHYYYLLEPKSTGCYTYSTPHSSSSTTYKGEKCPCGGGLSDRDYKCKTCGQWIYDRVCDCDEDDPEYEYGWNIAEDLRIGRIAYTDLADYKADKYDATVNTSALHRSKELTCTQATHGDYICDRVVTTLMPVNSKQTLTAGQSLDTTAYAKFLNGTSSIVNCSVSGYSPTKYNEWQTVTLSYGEFTSVSAAGPKKVTIQVYVERTDFDLTVKMESGINGSTTGTGKYNAGVNVTVGATTVPATGGYTFDGWSDGTSIVSKNLKYTFAMPAKNLTLTAMFTPITYKLNVKSEYTTMGTVTATVNGTSVTQAAYSSSVKVTATPKTGFTFEGWYDGMEKVSSTTSYTFTMPAHDVSLLAKFTAGQYTVSFNSNGGSACSSIKVSYLGTYGTLPAPTRAGYVFAGWKYNNAVITSTSPVTYQGNHTLTASWEKAVPEFILVKYSHLYGDNSWSNDSGNIGSLGLTTANLGSALPVPYKMGYSFVNWFSKEDETTGFVENVSDKTYVVTAATMMNRAEDHKLHAGWIENQYTLSFDSNGGTACSDMLVSYHRKYGYHQSLPTPTKDGYSFAGWYVTEVDNNGTGTQITDSSRVTTAANHTLYAKWSWDAVKVTVTFDGRTREQIGLSAAESKAAGYGSTIGTVSASSAVRTVTYPGTYGGHTITACYCKDSKHGSLKDFGGKHYVIDLNSASTALPTPTRTGYTFKNWVYAGNTVTAATELGVSFSHTVFATYTPKTYTVTLDGRGATTQTQKSVTMTFDEKGPNVTVPLKNGYTFMGYYSGVKGSGAKYYNADGTCATIWDSPDIGVTKLYAYWKPKEGTLPEEDEIVTPTPLPEKEVSGNVSRSESKALLYADDYDSSTGALTDLQPYLTYDTPGGEGVIPGTEELSFRAKFGAWMLNYKFKRYSGVELVKVNVTVPYRTQYEKSSDESLVISEQKTAAYAFEVPKAWSYWKIEENSLYYPESVTVINEALAGGSITVPVTGISEGTAVPGCETTKHASNIKWDSTDANGKPVVNVEFSEEQYIISYVPDTLPDIDAHLKIICKNAAMDHSANPTVRNDEYVFDGVTILSGAWDSDGNGDSPYTEGLPSNADFIPETSYTQTYQSGIELDEEKPNGFYETTAYITYKGDDGNIGTPANKTIDLADINDLRIHTPVACEGVAVDGLDAVKGEEDAYTLTLKEALNFFTLRIDNTGTHRLSLGYGTNDFSHALSGKSNVAEVNGSIQNQVMFPFDVYVDVGNNSRNADGTYEVSGDYLIEAGTWLTTEVEQRFYVPVTMKNGDYEIMFRSIAVNCPKEGGEWFSEGQEKVNTDSGKYIATDTIKLEVKSYLKEFRYTETDDPLAVKSLLQENSELILKKGYNFTYCLQTQGEFYGENVEFVMQPKFYWEKETGAKRKKVNVYRLEELLHEEERICFSWEEEVLLNHENYDVIRQYFTGRGRIPADILCVEESFDLEEYCRWETLSGAEDFLLKDGFLVIQFEIKVKSNNQCWYMWEDLEATTIRYDLSASVADDFEVGGVE